MIPSSPLKIRQNYYLHGTICNLRGINNPIVWNRSSSAMHFRQLSLIRQTLWCNRGSDDWRLSRSWTLVAHWNHSHFLRTILVHLKMHGKCLSSLRLNLGFLSSFLFWAKMMLESMLMLSWAAQVFDWSRSASFSSMARKEPGKKGHLTDHCEHHFLESHHSWLVVYWALLIECVSGGLVQISAHLLK